MDHELDICFLTCLHTLMKNEALKKRIQIIKSSENWEPYPSRSLFSMAKRKGTIDMWGRKQKKNSVDRQGGVLVNGNSKIVK